MSHVAPQKEILLEDGWYPAEIGEVEERTTKYGEKLLLPIEVDAGELGLVGIDAWLTLPEKATQKHYLVIWAKQLFGEREFDTEEFSGQQIDVFVEETETEEGIKKNKILKIRPSKKAAKATKGEKERVEIDESDFEDIPF